jgi:hypothetical protein
VETEKALDCVEARHMCPEKVLAELLAQKMEIISHAAQN